MSKSRYGISAIQYNKNHNLIASVKAHTVDDEDKLSDLRIYPRAAVIKAIDEQGLYLVTLPMAHDGKFTIGSEVILVEIENQKYLKIKIDATRDDNLGDLPEFQDKPETPTE